MAGHDDVAMHDLIAALNREIDDTGELQIVRKAVNADLIGRRGSRYELNTPALLIDIDILCRNIVTMAERCAAAGMALRPHAKTHKSAQISRLQMRAGAEGICVAKIGEAEALAANGVKRLLVTSPIAGEGAMRRFIELDAVTDDLVLAVDHPMILERLEAAASFAGRRISFVIDIDVGLKRTGTNDPAAVIEMAKKGAASSALKFRGIQAYGGHLQHIDSRVERRDATAAALAPVSEIVGRLRDDGIKPELITGGGTGTHLADLEQSVLNEIQAGSYLFMDRQYNEALSDEDCAGFETSLRLQTTVISVNATEWFTVDGGTKSFATDGPPPEVLSPRFKGADFLFLGDEHGVVIRSGDSPEPALGERIEFATPHCDPTVNLHDFYHLVQGDTLVGIWPVTARGASY